MKIFKLMAAAILAGAFSANAAEKPDTIKLWPEGAPNAFASGYSAEDLKKNNLVTDPILIVYPAEKPNGKAVVACPGGGYGYLAKYHEGQDMAPWFNDRGITYAVLLYRMPERHNDAPLSDAQQAIRLMRENAGKYGIKKVGIMGASAGGHLASTAATHFDNDAVRPDFQILFYPVISLDPEITHSGTRKNLLGNKPDPALNWLYSNETQVTPQTPPAFLMLSADDATVHPDNSIRYFQALKSAGVPVEMNIYPTGGHGWGFKDDFPYKPAWTASLANWLKELNK
ncbi:MAG: alpha/beta hydrolase [Clostridium sp.]|nr:alpha/beta hydrolase [Clostridium sp.]